VSGLGVTGLFSSTKPGFAPSPGAPSGKFLRDDGTWATPAGGSGISDGDYGDITVSGSGAVLTIDPGVVTLAQMASLAASRIIGQTGGGAGTPQALTAAQVKTVLAIAAGDVSGLATVATSGSALDLSGLATVALSGSASDLGTGTLPIARLAAGSVTLAKIEDLTADRILGRANGAGSGPPQQLTAAQVKTVLAIAAGDVTGLAAIATSGSASDLGTGTLPIARIANGDVTYAKIQNVSATDKVLGRSTAGAGVVEEIACTAAGRALIDDADATAQRATLGLASIAASGSASDLGAGTVPAARMPALTGDVTTSAGAVATAIGNNKVTNAMLADVATATFKGRTTAGTGDPEDLTSSQAAAILNLLPTSSTSISSGNGYQMYADGVDGTLHFDGAATVTLALDGTTVAPASSIYTLARDIFADSMTVDVGVTIKPAGFRIFVLNTLTNNGNIQANGGDGGAGAAGAGGTAGTAAFVAKALGGGVAGVAGASPTSGGSAGLAPASTHLGGVSGTVGPGANGGVLQGGGGGQNNAGTAGASVTTLPTPSVNNGDHFRDITNALTGRNTPRSTILSTGSSGAGGRGASAVGAGGSGGSGASGGTIVIVARIIAGSGTIQCKGGIGGAGNGNAGGSGGGSGGVVAIITDSPAPIANAVSVAGGVGGAAGGGGTSTAGGNGGSGLYYLFANRASL
jgi:hypothetical protein